MATVYLVTNTDKSKTITIQPGTLNGPTGVLSDSDINLHGVGALQWGNKLDENFLRLTENFACPESVTTPGTPMDAAELGLPGYGVNNPVIGQLWFNKTSDVLMVYTGTVWKQSGGTSFGATAPSTSPTDGDLWYDINYHAPGVGQLLVYNGGTWESVSEEYVQLDGDIAMAGDLSMDSAYRVTNLLDPINPQDAATMNYVDNEISTLAGTLSSGYLPLTGGTLTGNLSLTTHDVNLTSGKVMFTNMYLNEGNGTVSVAPDIRFNADGLMSADTSLRFNIDDDNNGTGEFIVAKGAETSAATVLFKIENNGTLHSNISNYETLVTHDDDIPNKKYVDDATASIPSGIVPEFFTTLSTSSKAGDIALSGGKIYIAIGPGGGTNWKQVWPAVYS